MDVTLKTEKKSYHQRHLEQIAGFAEKAFAEHELNLRHMSDCHRFAHWRCKKPKTIIYYFDISIEPGRLSISGDLGHLQVERTENMIAWCRGSIHSIGYFDEKVPHEITTKEWSTELANEWVAETRQELCEEKPEKYEQLLEELDLLSRYTEHRQEFEPHYADSPFNDGCDWPDLEAWTSGFLWQREAIKWFLDRVEYPPKQ